MFPGSSALCYNTNRSSPGFCSRPFHQKEVSVALRVRVRGNKLSVAGLGTSEVSDCGRFLLDPDGVPLRGQLVDFDAEISGLRRASGPQVEILWPRSDHQPLLLQYWLWSRELREALRTLLWGWRQVDSIGIRSTGLLAGQEHAQVWVFVVRGARQREVALGVRGFARPILGPLAQTGG